MYGGNRPIWGMLVDWAFCNMYSIEPASPGEAKKRGIVGTKVFLLQNERKKTEFECKITFLCGDDRNGEKHERKEMDFLLEERGCGGVSRMDSKG